MAVRVKFDSYLTSYHWYVIAFFRGNDFLKPLIVMEQSRLLGLENAHNIQSAIDKGDNVIILSNHQTEADPQVHSCNGSFLQWLKCKATALNVSITSPAGLVHPAGAEWTVVSGGASDLHCGPQGDQRPGGHPLLHGQCTAHDFCHNFYHNRSCTK